MLVSTGSPVGEPTVAILVSVPVAGADTVRVKLLAEPAVKLPKLQIMTPLLFTLPGLALAKLAPTGTVSVTVMLLAVEGPGFVTEIV